MILPEPTTVACLATALVFLSKLHLTTAADAPILVSKNIPVGDGNYCFYCKPPTIADAGACGSAAALNLKCFQDDASLQQTCPAALEPNGINLDSFDVLSATSARVCVNVAKCLYLCAVVDLAATQVEYVFCCFKPGSPLKAQFYDGSLTLPAPIFDNTPPPPTDPPPPKKKTGVPCDIVENTAKAYNMFKSGGHTGLGLWGQLLNLVCLGADPSCNVPECSRADQRRDPDCSTDDIPEGGFEQTVFQGFLGNIDYAALEAQAQSVDQVANAAAIAAQMEIISGGGLPAMRAFLVLGSFNDPGLEGTVMMGFLHFVEQLGPLFQKYLTDTVESATSLDDLRTKIAAIKKEHHHLFFCQVIPGFQIEDDLDEIPKLNTWVAKLIVPITASTIRNTELLAIMWKKFGFHPIDAFWKRDDNYHASPALSERAGFIDTFTSATDFLNALGYTPPKSPTLQSHFVNWQEPPDSIAWTIPNPPKSPQYPNIGPAEFSSAAGADIAVHRLLDNIAMTLEAKNRPGDLEDMMALVGLLPISSSEPALIPTLGKPVVVVGPMAVIWPNNIELIPGLSALLNLPNSGSTATTASATAVATTAPSFAGVTYTPTAPASGDKGVYYTSATLTLDVPGDSVWKTQFPGLDPGKDLVIVDLLTGEVLEGCVYTAPSGSNPGTLSVELKAGHGSWAGGFMGGGMFGIGVTKGGEIVRELAGWSKEGVKLVGPAGSGGAGNGTVGGNATVAAGGATPTMATQPPVGFSMTPAAGAPPAATQPPPAGGAGGAGAAPDLLPTTTTYALNTSTSTDPFATTASTSPAGLGSYIFQGMGGDRDAGAAVTATAAAAANGTGGVVAFTGGAGSVEGRGVWGAGVLAVGVLVGLL